MSAVDINAKIPNNVELASDRRLQRALESWQPKFIDWWKHMGPVAFNDTPVYLRTAVSVDPNIEIVFIDTPAAYPGIESEERGVAEAIAVNLREMMMLDTPIVVVVSGEGGSGGALGIGEVLKGKGKRDIDIIKPDPPFGWKITPDQWLYLFTLAVVVVMFVLGSFSCASAA